MSKNLPIEEKCVLFLVNRFIEPACPDEYHSATNKKKSEKNATAAIIA